MPQQNSSTGTVQKNPSTSTLDTNKNTASASAQDQNKNSLSGSTQGNMNNPQGSQQRTSSAASQSNDNSTMQNNNSQDAIKRVVQKFVQECWNQGNLNVASELLTERVRFHDPVFPNLNAGVENIKNHIEQCRQAFPDLKFTIEDTIAERNEVVLHWTLRGTHKGQFLGMAPTNRQVILDGTSIYRLDGNKIAEGYANWNLASMMLQLGVIKLPEQARVGASHEATQGTR